MQVIRKRDVDGVDLRIGQHRFVAPVGFRNIELFRLRLRFILVPTGNADQFTSQRGLNRRNDRSIRDRGAA
ncbi:hypothetical protein D3C81_2321950 [compost metagenome]